MRLMSSAGIAVLAAALLSLSTPQPLQAERLPTRLFLDDLGETDPWRPDQQDPHLANVQQEHAQLDDSSSPQRRAIQREKAWQNDWYRLMQRILRLMAAGVIR